MAATLVDKDGNPAINSRRDDLGADPRADLVEGQADPARLPGLGRQLEQQVLPVEAGLLRDEPGLDLRLPGGERQGSAEPHDPGTAAEGEGRFVPRRRHLVLERLLGQQAGPRRQGDDPDIMAPDKVEAVYEKVGGRWYPVYKDLANAKWWKDRPYFDQFPQILETARPGWYPATATPKLLAQLSAAGPTARLRRDGAGRRGERQVAAGRGQDGADPDGTGLRQIK